MGSQSQYHVVVTLPVLLLGGTEMQTRLLVQTLTQAGYAVTVCCFYESDSEMMVMMQEAGARVEVLGQRWEDGLFALLKGVATFMRHEKPDIVHVQYMSPGFIAVLAARLVGVRTVFATVHQPGRTYGWKAKLLLRLAAAMCSQFFCISRSVEESWFGESVLFDPKSPKRHRHCTIYNAVDVALIQQLVEQGKEQKLRKKLNLEGVPVIGCIGRLRQEKGQAVLLDAMPMVLKNMPNAKVILIGDGPDRQALEEQSNEVGISDAVIWLGSLSHDEAMMQLSVMDVLVVPSLFEGFGLVAAEGMAAGLSVVGSHVDGLAEVIEHKKTGLLFTSGDSSALTERLLLMLNSSPMMKSMREVGQGRVKELFSMEGYEKIIISAYRGLVRK